MPVTNCRRYIISALSILLFVIFSLTSCGGEQSANSAIPTIIDREGKEVNIPAKVEKIVSMSPAFTETLVNLGLGSKIVAIDMYSEGIDGIPKDLPIFDMMSPDTESIAALMPDIIFATGMSKADGDDPYKPITDLGVLMTYVPAADSIEAIKQDILLFGKITGTSSKAESIVKELEQEIENIVSKIPDTDSGKKVFFEISDLSNIYSFGSGVFLNEMIEILKAKNVFADQSEWLMVSEEAVIEKNPDVIFTNADDIADPISIIKGRNGWEVISAVKNDAVYLIDRDSSSQPNENITVALRQMAAALYPDTFK